MRRMAEVLGVPMSYLYGPDDPVSDASQVIAVSSKQMDEAAAIGRMLYRIESTAKRRAVLVAFRAIINVVPLGGDNDQ